MRRIQMSFLACALVSTLAACSGAAPSEPSTAPTTGPSETTTAPQRLDDPIVIGSIDWECYDLCVKSFVASYCENACTR